MTRYEPASRPTLYFIGVTTGQSSIMQVFPAWADHLGLDAAITGIDLPLDDSPANYRAVVEYILLNPIRCREPLAPSTQAYLWSSAAAHRSPVRFRSWRRTVPL